jgi:flavin reductase (DIM6/NTAB) family NADH-FMN oxidoreductase RutF
MKVNLFDYLNKTLKIAETFGVLLVSIDRLGKPNIMTIGWLLLGRSYHGNPIAVVAVRPARYSFKLLDEVEEFVIAVPTPELEKAVAFCGEKSGRDVDKFKETGLTPIPSVHVRLPSIKECIINIECRIYNKVSPPHYILTSEHRKAPIPQQHTIYFAEVLGVYKYE